MENKGQERKYKKISFQERMKLIEMVCQQKMPSTLAAQQLGLSPSTAKMIIKKYREEGKIFEKKQDKTRRELLLDIQNKMENSRQNSINQQRNQQGQVQMYYYIPYIMTENMITPGVYPYPPEYIMPY